MCLSLEVGNNSSFPSTAPGLWMPGGHSFFLPEAESPRGLGTPTGWLLLGFALGFNLNYSFDYPKETTTARFFCQQNQSVCLLPVLELWDLGWLCLVLPRSPPHPLLLVLMPKHPKPTWPVISTSLCPPHPGFPLLRDSEPNNHKPLCPRCCLSLRWIILPFSHEFQLSPFPSLIPFPLCSSRFLLTPVHPQPVAIPISALFYLVFIQILGKPHHFLILIHSNISLPLASFHPKRK